MNKFMTFEDWLKEEHAQDYIGTHDDMPDAFNDWLELEADVWIQYGDRYAQDVLAYNNKNHEKSN